MAHLNPQLQSTPQGKGSGRRVPGHDTKEKPDKCDSYSSYLEEDISKEQVFTIEDFVKVILRCDNWTELVQSQKVQDLSKDVKYNDLLKHFAKSKTEVELYNRFVDLANYVLKNEDTSKPCPITVCRNDPIPIRGSVETRKPDVVGTDSKDIDGTPRISPENCKEGPKKFPFHWLEILWYLEFKLRAKAKWEMEQFVSSSGTQPVDDDDKVLDGDCAPDHVPGAETNSNRPQSSKKRPRSPDDDELAENKRKREQSETDVKKQCASYALEMMSNGGLRTHAVGLYMNGGNLQMHYFDRSIFVSSASFSIFTEPCKFIALLFVLRGLSDRRWGFAPTFDRHFITPTTPRKKLGLRSNDFLTGKVLKLNDGRQVEFAEVLSRYHGLIGRGTIVVRAFLQEDKKLDRNNVVAIKISSPPLSRRNEADLIRHAHEKATGAFSEMIEHLPAIHHCEDIDLGKDSPQEALAEFFKNGEYERRALRVIAFRMLQPIHELVDVKESSKVFRDVFNCYRWLYEKAEIQHRDISLSNIMYHRKEGKVYGVLNDLDLATRVGDTSPSSKQRTGTVVFMAADLLFAQEEYSIPHLYWHDLESLFYVILLHASRFSEGKEIANPPLQIWFSTTKLPVLAALKLGLYHKPKAYGMPRLTEPHKSFSKWLDPMRDLFRRALQSQNTDKDGDIVTFDRIAGILAVDI